MKRIKRELKSEIFEKEFAIVRQKPSKMSREGALWIGGVSSIRRRFLFLFLQYCPFLAAGKLHGRRIFKVRIRANGRNECAFNQSHEEQDYRRAGIVWFRKF